MTVIAGHPTVDSIATPPGCGKGYIPRDYSSYPLGGLKFAKSAPTIKAMTDAELKEAIEYKTAKKAWISDRFDLAKLPVKNQQNSNYCWAHGAVRCCEACYVFSGGRVFVLSAFDVAACIKGGRNQGGSGIVAVEWIAQNGVCREDFHKPMDFDSSRSSEQSANASLHKIEAYDDLEPSDRNLIYTYVVNDIAVTVGIPVWGHEVAITYLALEGGTVYPGIDNSWGTGYGNNGRAVLHGAYTRFDEAGAVRLMTPAAE